MSKMTGGQAIVEALERAAVRVIFGVPGTQILSIYDALYSHPNIRHITVRHEQGAAYMADGYARASGEMGVCVTVGGPGAANTLTALGEAYADSSPILLISGQIESILIDREQEDFHEIRRTLDVYGAVTARARRLMRVEDIPLAIAEAFASVRASRPRPIYLEIPQDLLTSEAEVNIIEVPTFANPPTPDAESIEQAVRLLEQAERPLLYAGGGVISSGASEELVRLAELLGAPVAMSRNALGAIAADHPLALGDGWGYPPAEHVIARGAMERADVMLAVGTRFDPMSTIHWTLRLPERLIHVDIDPSELGKHYPAQVGIVGDARDVLERLIERLRKSILSPRKCWFPVADAHQAWERAMAARAPVEMQLLRAVRAALDRDAIVCHDLNQVSYWAGMVFPVYEPRTNIMPSGLGALGFGFPAALGAKLARPERQVVALCGDGGFLYTCQELATAVQERLAVVAVVFNDAALGAIKAHQLSRYGGRVYAADLSPVDFVGLARAFGAEGQRVERHEDLTAALRDALRASGPVLLEVPLPPGLMPPWLE